jgi:hypothetical protein
MARILTTIALVTLIAALGCPNNGPGPVEPNGGDDQPVADAVTEPVEVVEPPPPPAEYQGEPGTLKIKATFNGSTVAALIEIRRTGQTDVVDSATMGGGMDEAQFSLPPGRYDIRAVFPGAVDNAADVREGLRIRSGETANHEFAFDSVAQVTLECKRGGRNVNGKIKLRRPGGTDYPIEVECGNEFFIGGGEWEAEVTVGSGRSPLILQTSVHINGGGVLRTPIMIEGGGR